MPELVRPTVVARKSYLAALDEFRAEGRLEYDDRLSPRYAGAQFDDVAFFEQYVKSLLDQALEDSPRPEGYVPGTLLWFVDGEHWIGRVGIRHRLSPSLIEFGGHIGYAVRPSMRLRGYATAMLRDSLPIAADLGIDPALVTCSVDNIGSRKVIEANGGVLEDERKGTLRFWVPTRPD